MSTMRRKDVGRLQAYRAEEKALGSYTERLTPREVENLVVAALGQRVPIEFRDGDGRATAWGVLYGPFARLLFTHRGNGVRKWIVLHECAHLLTDDGHGPQWRSAYVLLVRKYISDEAADQLRHALDTEPLRMQSMQRRRWQLVVRFEEGRRQLAQVHGARKDPEQWKQLNQQAIAMLQPGETLGTLSEGDSVTWFGVRVVNRAATESEAQLLTKQERLKLYGRAIIRNGMLFQLREVKPAKVASPGGR